MHEAIGKQEPDCRKWLDMVIVWCGNREEIDKNALRVAKFLEVRP